MKHYFKNNKGMTYVELLVAFTLLVLIVFAFSPMILQSYDFLYKAGEMNINTYDAKSSMEERLATRENDPFYNINMNFNGMNDQFEIKARQVFTEIQNDARGLVTLYTNPPVRIQIKSDTTIFDDYENKAIAIKFINFPSGRVIFGDATKAVDGAVAPDGKYVVSLELTEAITNDNVPATLETKLGGSNISDKKPDALLYFNAIDITHTPLRLVAHYYNEYGQLKLTETYLHIKPANIMFVGKTSGSASYYSSAGANDDGSLIISNRTMPSAAIPSGITLNDVSWISPEEDSTYGEGYYMMCGENSTVRRLWHLTENTSAGREAIFKYEEDSEVINSKRYYKYKWAYDYADIYGFSAQKNGADASFTSGDSTKRNVYCDESGVGKTISYAFSFNGYTANFANTGSGLRRISYVLKSTLEEANAAGYTYRKGYYSLRSKPSITDINVQGINPSRSGERATRACLYCPEDNTWYYVSDWKYKITVTYVINGMTSLGIKGYDNWISGDQYYSMGDDSKCDGFFCRDTYGCKDSTPVDWVNDGAYLNEKSRADDKIYACLVMKAYNNVSDSWLNDTSYASASPSSTVNKVSLTSCSVLPGNSDGLYLGTTNAYAFINQTDATESEITATRADGTFTGYAVIGNNLLNSTMYTFTQKQDYSNFSNWGKNYGGTAPDKKYVKNQYFGNRSSADKVETSDLYFTMGYASKLSLIYDQFTINDSKPLEKFYQKCKGITSISGNELNNIWLTREFYNLTASTNYKNSVVSVGYNVSGYAKKQFQYCYTTLGKDYDMNVINNYHNSDWVFTPPVPVSGGGNGWGQSYSSGGKSFLYWSDKTTYDKDYWVIIPRTIVGSTALDKLTNDGVMSIYNAGDASFTNIYYYKAPGQQSARFNCVAIGEASATQLNAFIGASNSQLIVAPLGYSNGKIATTPILDKNCTKIAMTDVQSVDAVEVSDSYVFAGGKNTSGSKNSVLYYSDNGGKTFSKVSLPNTAGYDVTSIAAAKEYVYVVASNGTNSVVCYAKLNKAGAAGQWRTQSKYQTKVTYSMDDGTPISNSSTLAQLPLIKAVATQN